MIKSKLASAGHEVLTAVNGEEAIKIFNEQHPKIMILDVMMPKIDGFEVLSRVKKIDKDIEVIFITAIGEGIEEFVQKDFFHCIYKPFSPRELLKITETCLEYIDLKKKDPLKAENFILKWKLDRITEEYKRLIQKSQERVKDHSDSMTLSEFGNIIAGITHSLTNEIGIINSTAEGLLNKKVKEDSNIKRYKRLLRSAKYCNILLNNLRSILLEGKLTPTKVDIKKVLLDVITLFEYRIPSNIKLITEISPNLPRLIIDKSQIEQVLVNTITNAIEAMPEGGELSIKVKKRKPNLNIKISDTGVGIPKENLKNVFELYFSTKKKGSGLGLYLTKRIIEHYNGKVSIKSEEGKGTTIIINLPIGKEK